MKIERRKCLKKSFHLRKIPWKLDFFPTIEGNSQSPVKTLLFPISHLLDDEDNFTSRQRAPRPGLVLKKGQRDSYWLFKTWPPGSIVRDITVPLETHFPKAGFLPCFQVSGRFFSSIAGLYPQLYSDSCCQTSLPPPPLWWSNFSRPSLQPSITTVVASWSQTNSQTHVMCLVKEP